MIMNNDYESYKISAYPSFPRETFSRENIESVMFWAKVDLEWSMLASVIVMDCM